MITIIVDEAYAYDVLAIANVKVIKNIPNSNKNLINLNKHIEQQIGEKLHLEILNSIQYKKLLKTNIETFDAVELARYGTISAKEVDNLNMKRYNCKLELQNKFFPNSEILEKKS